MCSCTHRHARLLLLLCLFALISGLTACNTATYSGTLPLVTPTVTLSSVSSPYGSTTPATITASESGSAGLASGSVVTFGVTSPATGTFSPATCTIADGSCSVSYAPTGTLAAASYTNDLTATFSASGVYPTRSAASTLTVIADSTFSYKQIYSFDNGPALPTPEEDGTQPEYGNLVQGSDGNFYGTTINGGQVGHGTVYCISASGAYTQLHAFTQAAIAGTSATDGGRPTAGLVQGSDGFFYGTTTQGGGSAGDGTIFRISSTGVYTQLYVFTGAAIAGTNQIDGAEPLAGLIQGTDGYFYGLTLAGGAKSHGTIFRISPGGAYTQLYAFTGAAIAGSSPAQTDGADPYEASLIQGSDGNFYGVTDRGGTKGYGTVFRISATGAYTQIYAFTKAAIAGTSPAQTDGASPGGGLIQGSDGNFYGSTIGGGAGGDGTLFRITAAGTYTQLYAFTEAAIAGTSQTDGGYPSSNLAQGSDGNFYGTTQNGGAKGYGTVFQISTAGAYSQLYAFTYAPIPGTSHNDGDQPFGGLTQGSDGNLYGTTVNGGDAGEGTAFKLSPSPGLAAPVTLTIPAGVMHGNPFTLSYAVANAVSTAGVTATGPSTLQNCFATNTAGDTTGWTGSITGSSTAQNTTLTAPSTAGTYTYSLTCGGLESSVVTLVVQ